MKSIEELTDTELLDEARKISVHFSHQAGYDAAILKELIRRFELSTKKLEWKEGEGIGEGIAYWIIIDTVGKAPIGISTQQAQTWGHFIVNPFPKTLEEAKAICESHYRQYLKDQV